jgi:hypothetical protein
MALIGACLQQASLTSTFSSLHLMVARYLCWPLLLHTMMLILLFVAAALNLNAFSAPVTTSIDVFDPLPPLSFLGRDIPIPECINPARYRTLQQIILSCLATVFTCTWVSLHPNVPDPRNSRWRNFTMRMKTMVWALTGPEFITIWAFRQRMAAARHVDDYNSRHQCAS